MANPHGNMEDRERGPDEGTARRIPSFINLYRPPSRKHMEFSTVETLLLSYQTLGVVYGDLGTSPLYVFSSITSLSNPEEQDFLGIMSLIFWTLTVIALFKYVFIVLHADDHGEGGTFALYSLLRQHVRFQSKVIAPCTRLDSDMNLRFHSKHSDLRSVTHKFIEGSKKAQVVLTFIVLLGTCMVIGDGALTPAISVLSAVQGIQSRSAKITQQHVVILSTVILIILFVFQKYGTSKVSSSFSPIMVLWFISTAGIGVYNIIKYYPGIFKSLSPYYAYLFFLRNHKKGWEALGAVVLCITGAEAMFADMGHFSMRAIQIAYSSIVYPALILAYGGQAAFLIKNPDKLSTTFYSSIPETMFWPMFVVATLAAIVASQALISASFSIIRQSVALGCFPRVTIKHTSSKHEGQIYVPEVNYFLMVICILLVVGFKGGVEISNAFGVAVIWVMLITTFLMAVVMLVIWHTSVLLVALFLILFVGIEGVYMSSLMIKLSQGAWVPFAISTFFLVITLSWTFGRSKKTEFEAERQVDREELNQLIMSNVTHVPGICLFCTDLTNGIPPIVRHYVQHVGCLREIMVMVTVRTLPVRCVLREERFIVAKLGPTGVYRCLVQYGYMDEPSFEGDFVKSMMSALMEDAEDQKEARVLQKALSSGVTFVLGRTLLMAGNKRSKFEKLVINDLYRFLQKNSRSTATSLRIPRAQVLQVGMVYEI